MGLPFQFVFDNMRRDTITRVFTIDSRDKEWPIYIQTSKLSITQRALVSLYSFFAQYYLLKTK